MFEWIEFRNYKALRKATLPLSRFTLVVGANGSGKSTALNAFFSMRDARQRRGRMPYSKRDLKRQLYGFSHPSLSFETEVMKRAAERLSKDLTLIEGLFPAGFGALAKALRAW